MRKVMVLREMPKIKKGTIFAPSEFPGFNLLWDIEELIQDGWLEEVVEEKNLVDKLNEIDNHLYIRPNEVKAKIALTHAVEVAEKTIKEYELRHTEHNCKSLRHFIIEALKKEAEG